MANASHTPIPTVVETLRTMFQRAHDEMAIAPRQMSELLRDEIGVEWPEKELRRFMLGETKRPTRPLTDVTNITLYLAGRFEALAQQQSYVQIPLSEGQRRLIHAGVIDMNALQEAIARELERQVVALARPGAAKPKI